MVKGLKPYIFRPSPATALGLVAMLLLQAMLPLATLPPQAMPLLATLLPATRFTPTVLQATLLPV